MDRWKCNTALEAQSGARYHDFSIAVALFSKMVCLAKEGLNVKTVKGIMQSFMSSQENRLCLGILSAACVVYFPLASVTKVTRAWSKASD